MSTDSNSPDLAINGWKITDKRFVAYIDIMGFKDLVARNSHKAIYDMMKRIDYSKNTNASIKWGKKDNAIELITTTTYSDSIIIYSKDDSYDSLYSIICTASGFAYDLLINCIPFKGALACGDMTLDNKRSIFFGQPLIDAYLLQEELGFYGLIVHATAEEMIDSFNKTKQVFPFLKKHKCILKNGVAQHLTIFPIFILKGVEYVEKRDLVFESLHKMRFKTSGYLRKYIDFTEEYLREIISDKK